jgi:hypothetical protein
MPDDIESLNDSLTAQLHELRAGKQEQAASEEPAAAAEAGVEAATAATESGDADEAGADTEATEQAESGEEGAEQDAPDKAPVKVTLGGREVEVDPDVADLIRRDLDTRAGTYGAELQRLREQVSRLEGAASVRREEPDVEPDVQPPDPELLNPASEKFDPRLYNEQMLAYHEAVLVTTVQGLEDQRRAETTTAQTKHQQEQSWAQYVAKFYEANPDLAGAKEVVTAVYRESLQDLRQLPSDEAVYAELARRSRTRAKTIASSFSTPAAPKAPVLASSRAAGPSAKPKAVEREDTITDLLRQRREAAAL